MPLSYPLQIVSDKHLNARRQYDDPAVGVSNNNNNNLMKTPVKYSSYHQRQIQIQHPSHDQQYSSNKENNTPIEYANQQATNKRSDHHLESNKNQPAPKKKKEKLSALCKTPPSTIKMKGKDYKRGDFLGEGGFARCFQIKDETGTIYAAKTVAKSSIKSEKTRKKLLSEIQIHRSMKHTSVVEFIDCFEDDVNVYILLEMCCNGSLMDLMKKRKTLTEPEVKFITVQISGGVKYLHDRGVIHRDLKLGNIFFDQDYNLKIGDFGLAAIVSEESEKKYTVCGTPNYIAPEVLTGGKTTGHSFEVDIWSIGIMIYAMLFGKPPFQSKDVNKIYQRIKCGDFQFPPDKDETRYSRERVSEEAKILIEDLLATDPLERPSIDDIMDYVWFRKHFPPRLPYDVETASPHFDFSSLESFENFRTCMTKAGLLITEREKRKPIHIFKDGVFHTVRSDKYILPHCLSPSNAKAKYIELVDYQTHVKLNQFEREYRLQKAQQIKFEQKQREEEWKKKQLLAAQNSTSLLAESTNHIRSDLSLRILASECHMTLNGILSCEQQKIKYFEQKHQNERMSHNQYQNGVIPVSDDERENISTIDSECPIIVTKWVDYSNKHGFSYQLSTDDIGVLFNNGCTILNLADADEFWYINADEKDGWAATHYALNTRPQEFNKHLEVVEFFSKYMQNNLNRVSTFKREVYHKDDVFLRRYTRYNQYVMFELSDGTFQFNFKDHNKYILSNNGHVMTYISPSREQFVFNLIDLMKYGSVPNYSGVDLQKVLAYIKEGLKQKSLILSQNQQVA